MDKYIKSKSLLNALKEERKNGNFVFTLKWIKEIIDNLPTVDVVEVMHGKWEAGHYEGGIFDGTNFEKCNVCQFERLFDDIRFKTTYNYCPNCGAKMDLKEGAEE